MPRFQLYGFVILGIFAALLLAWLMDSGTIWLVLLAVAIAALWLGRQCVAIDRQLQGLHLASDRLLKALSARGQLAEQLFAVAVKFDDGDRLGKIAFAEVDEVAWQRRSVQAIDETVREALGLMEERALVGDQPAYLQQKQRLLDAQGQIHRAFQQFNQQSQSYNAARQSRPVVWLEQQLAFPLAPAISLTDDLLVARLQAFVAVESPFWRDLLKTIGGAIAFGLKEVSGESGDSVRELEG